MNSFAYFCKDSAIPKEWTRATSYDELLVKTIGYPDDKLEPAARLLWCQYLAETNRLNPAGYVYGFRRQDAQNSVKIGFSKNPVQRKLSLEDGTPYKLDLCMLVSGDRELETAFHNALRFSRIRGEWYDSSKWGSDYLPLLERVAMGLPVFDAGTRDPIERDLVGKLRHWQWQAQK